MWQAIETRLFKIKDFKNFYARGKKIGYHGVLEITAPEPEDIENNLPYGISFTPDKAQGEPIKNIRPPHLMPIK